jgi:hypothetical protein
MSRFREQVGSARPSHAQGDTADMGQLRECFPELAAALIPGPTPENGVPEESFTLMIFVKDGRVRFCLSSRDADVCAFGELPDPGKGLDGVEAEILAGRLGWKTEGRRKRA